MKCPNCKKEVNFIAPVIRNLETYGTNGESKMAVSSCCGTAFNVNMKITFTAEIYTGEKEEDDWGNKVKKV